MAKFLWPTVPVSCRTFAIRSSVSGVTRSMSFNLSEPPFPHLQSGCPNTDFSALLGLNESTCKDLGLSKW